MTTSNLSRRLPARHFAGNLMWDRHGGVHASWLLHPLPRPETEAQAQPVRRAHAALYRALTGRSWLLRGLLTWTDPGSIASKLLERATGSGSQTTAIDLDTHPEWAAEVLATMDLLEQIPLGRRRFILTVRLTPSFRDSLRTSARAALNYLSEEVGITAEPPTRAEIRAYLSVMAKIEASLPQQFRPQRLTAAEQIWALRHAQSRSGLGDLDPVDNAAALTDLSDVTGRAAIGRPWLDPMALSDLEPEPTVRGALRQMGAMLKAPLERRLLKVVTDGGEVSYQAGMVLAGMPAAMTFPVTEFLSRMDDAGVPVDFAIRGETRSRHEAQRRNKRAMSHLNDQLHQIDGEGRIDISSHQTRLFDAANLLEDYNIDLQRAEKEVEVECVIMLSTAAPTAEEAEANAAALVKAGAAMDFTYARPPGAEEKIFWGMQPGTKLSHQLLDYRQIGKSMTVASAGAVVTSELGTEHGWLLGINTTTALWSPVFVELFGGENADSSPAVAFCGELGSGKSFGMKKVAGANVDRGARMLAVDSSTTREWFHFARSLRAGNRPISVAYCDVAEPTTSLDPLRILPPDLAKPVAQSFLITLLNVAATSREGQTLGKVLKPSYREEHGISSLGALHRHLTNECELPAAAQLADSIDVFADSESGGSLAAALFDDRLPPVDLNAQAIVIGTSRVALPSQSEVRTQHLFQNLSVEKILGRALFALVARLAKELAFRDPTEDFLFVTDEFHYYRGLEEALQTFVAWVRDGRKVRAALIMGTHDPEADFPDETLRGLIKHRIGMRHTDKTLAARTATFLGIDPNEHPEEHALMVGVIRGLSPVVDGKGVPEERRGEAVYRDARGRIGEIQILRPGVEERFEAAKTTPADGSHAMNRQVQQEEPPR